MESNSKSNLLETVDTAIEYSAKLEKNLNLVLKAEQQVGLIYTIPWYCL